MKKLLSWSLVGALLAAMIAVAPSAYAKKIKTEDELIAEMESPTEKIAVHAMLEYEKTYPTSTKALPVIKKNLADSRVAVRIKAARVLGSLHAEVSKDELKTIAAMMESSDKKEAMEAVKSLRGLRSQPVIPQIVKALEYPDDNVKRDACRTLAVVADKSVIPKIEPLLQFPSPKVQKDAMDAIAALKMK